MVVYVNVATNRRNNNYLVADGGIFLTRKGGIIVALLSYYIM